MSLLGTPEYKFVAYLNPDMLRVTRNRLVSEVTIFCKVQRKVEKGEPLELFDPLAVLKLPHFNREQRKRLAKSKVPDALRDTIRAPAAVVIPAAIYR